MPLIPESELERIKSEIDLAALIRAKGIELKPHGSADLVGRCPFHKDKTPSLVVTPKKGLWHCLGACQKGGTVIDFVMKADGVSFRHAVEILRDGRAQTLLSTKSTAKVATIPKLPPPVSADMDDQTLLNQVTDYYHKALLTEPSGGGREYLARRGLWHPEAVEVFRLGYADRTLGLRLPDSNREAGAKIRERLVKLGVFRRESGHEHLRGSLIVPILDSEGNTLNLYGRKAREDFREARGSKHLYLPGPHRGFWNPDCLQEKESILCESLIDALSFWVNGFRNVTTAYGVEGFTEEMLSAFLKSGVRRVLLAYDRDEAGDRAAQKLASKLMGEGLECLRVLFPHGMDANEYILKVKPADKALRLLLHGAEWIGRKPESVALSVPAMPAAEPPQIVALPSGETVDMRTGEVLPTTPSTEPPSLGPAHPASPEDPGGRQHQGLKRHSRYHGAKRAGLFAGDDRGGNRSGEAGRSRKPKVAQGEPCATGGVLARVCEAHPPVFAQAPFRPGFALGRRGGRH